MRKGDLVMLDISKCFTKEQGGSLQFPLGNYSNDADGLVLAARPSTPEEKQAWRDSPYSKGMNDAGETKLPPTSTSVALKRDRIYIVERARAAPMMNYRPNPGMTKVRCTETGETAYIKRELLEVVSERYETNK